MAKYTLEFDEFSTGFLKEGHFARDKTADGRTILGYGTCISRLVTAICETTNDFERALKVLGVDPGHNYQNYIALVNERAKPNTPLTRRIAEALGIWKDEKYSAASFRKVIEIAGDRPEVGVCADALPLPGKEAVPKVPSPAVAMGGAEDYPVLDRALTLENPFYTQLKEYLLKRLEESGLLAEDDEAKEAQYGELLSNLASAMSRGISKKCDNKRVFIHPWHFQGFAPLPRDIPVEVFSNVLSEVLFSQDSGEHERYEQSLPDAAQTFLAARQQVHGIDVTTGLSEGTMSHIGEIMRLTREWKGMRQKDMAEAAGIAESSWSRYEQGETIQSSPYVNKISDALQFSAKAKTRLLLIYLRQRGWEVETAERDGTFGELLRVYRNEKGDSLEALAKKSTISLDKIFKYENEQILPGHHGEKGSQRVRKLAAGLELTQDREERLIQKYFDARRKAVEASYLTGSLSKVLDALAFYRELTRPELTASTGIGSLGDYFSGYQLPYTYTIVERIVGNKGLKLELQDQKAVGALFYKAQVESLSKKSSGARTKLINALKQTRAWLEEMGVEVDALDAEIASEAGKAEKISGGDHLARQQGRRGESGKRGGARHA